MRVFETHTYDRDMDGVTYESKAAIDAFPSEVVRKQFEWMLEHGETVTQMGDTTFHITNIKQPDPYTVKPADIVPVPPGTKLDTGKIRPTLLIMSLHNAMQAMSEVLTFGASKYSDDGWRLVPNGIDRYTNAMLRHLLQEDLEFNTIDDETGLLHAAHTAVNAVLRLELILREE